MENEHQVKLPPVTVGLAVINVVVWIVLEWMGDTQDSQFMLAHGAAYLPLIVDEGEWWRLLICMFLHFGADHLVNNMLMLGIMGMRLERVLGSVRFGILYLLSGLCGSMLSLYEEMHMAEFAVSAGASGAVFGIVGGLLACAALNKGKIEGLTLKGLLFMAALSLYYGFSTAGVDNAGHIGGLLGGILLGILLKMIDFRKRNPYTIE